MGCSTCNSVCWFSLSSTFGYAHCPDPAWPFTRTRLGNVHRAHRLRHAASLQYRLSDARPMWLRVRLQLLDRHLVDAARALVAHHPLWAPKKPLRALARHRLSVSTTASRSRRPLSTIPCALTASDWAPQRGLAHSVRLLLPGCRCRHLCFVVHRESRAVAHSLTVRSLGINLAAHYDLC